MDPDGDDDGAAVSNLCNNDVVQQPVTGLGGQSCIIPFCWYARAEGNLVTTAPDPIRFGIHVGMELWMGTRHPQTVDAAQCYPPTIPA
jgi:hypothetical protein